MTDAPTPLLEVDEVSVRFGAVQALERVSLEIRRGEIVAIIGPNGAGKTTLLRAISGLVPWNAGGVTFAGLNIAGIGPRETARRGLAHVIEGHRIFTNQTVTDNLLLAGYDVPRAERDARVDEALSYFPEIAAKRYDRGSTLSGGQQQMLAVAQGLVRQPKLLMLDEPSAGLSPVLVDRVLAVVTKLQKTGTAVLLVEQLIEKALAVANRVYALAQGKIVLQASTDEADLPRRLEQAYFGSEAA